MPRSAMLAKLAAALCVFLAPWGLHGGTPSLETAAPISATSVPPLWLGSGSSAILAEWDAAGLSLTTAAGGALEFASIRTEGMTLAGRAFPVELGTLHSDRETVILDRELVDDHYLRTPQGIKQSWIVAAPSGMQQTDSLELQIGFAGLAPSLASADALRLNFSESSTTLDWAGFTSFDATGTDIPVTLTVDGSSVRIRLEGDALQFPITIDPILSLPPAWSVSGSATAELGTSLHGGADLNGDGLDDFVAGAPGALDGIGRVRVFQSTPTGTPQTLLEYTGPGMDSRLGEAVAIGDVTGDSIPDLVLGAPGTKTGGESRGLVAIIAGPLLASVAPPSIETATHLISGAVDVRSLGRSLALADLNGDGVLDVVVGAKTLGGSGQVTAILGGATPQLTGDFLAPSSDPDFGAALSSAGTDLGGLGRLLVGSPNYSGALPETGAVFAATLGASGWQVEWWIEGTSTGDQFGASVVGDADFDGDGSIDLAVGISGRSAGSLASAGAVEFYSPLPTTLAGPSALAVSPRLTIRGTQAGEQLGGGLHRAASLDGDARPDLLIGARRYDGAAGVDSGRTLVVSGRQLSELPSGVNDWTADKALWVIEGAGGQFGAAFTARSDFDGDARPDMLISAPVDGEAAGGSLQLYSGFDDCNENALPDLVELQLSDCNSNDLLDDCEPDCDEDFTPDDCEEDCDGDGIPDDCEEEEDCNGNGLHDDCELALGLTDDCNSNFIHDDCEPDCDGDGYPDDCEIDCDGDGYPAVCDDDDICIQDLVCSVTSNCRVDVTWHNAGDFDHIRITFAGEHIKTVDGDDEYTQLRLPANSVGEVCLIPYDDGHDGRPSCCLVDCDAFAPQPPQNLVCGAATDALGNCAISASWQNQGSYSELEVLIDGALVAIIDGQSEFVTLFGQGPGMHEFCLRAKTSSGSTLDLVCCNVDCGGAPTPRVENLMCNVVAGPTCEVQISWTNGATDYDMIRVLQNGVVIEELAGAATNTTAVVGQGSTSNICIVAVRNMVSSEEVCCNAMCPQVVAPPPVAGLVCDPITFGTGCDTTLTWMNGAADYDSIEIRENGILIAVLPGTDTTFDPAADVPEGTSTEYCVRAIRDGLASSDACCLAVCPAVVAPPPVTGLVCGVDAQGTTCDVTLTWVNGAADYDAIRITANGALIAMLPGTDTTFDATLGQGVSAMYCVQPVRTGLFATEACCTADCPAQMPPPSAMMVDCAIAAGPICTATVTWINGATDYDEIRILEDGALAETLLGDATSYMTTLVEGNMVEICVVPVRDNLLATAACCTAICPAINAPLSVTDLLCPVTPGDPCTVNLSWTNAENDYEEIRIFEDGVLLASLGGMATSFMATLGEGQMANYCVRPIRGGLPAADTCCAASCPAIVAPLAVNTVACNVMEGPICTVNVTWVNTEADYDEIRIFEDGALADTLLGDATSYMTTLVEGVSAQICVVPVRSGLLGPEACCVAACPAINAPPPVTNLLCPVTTGLVCSFDLTWMNGATDYDEIRIFVGGALSQILPFDATSATVLIAEGLTQEICVIPVRGGLLAPQTCCMAMCPAIDPPPSVTDLMCNVVPGPICDVTVSWTNPVADYDEIRIFENGALVETLGGMATSYMAQLGEGVMAQYCVVPVRTTLPGTEACCVATCPFVPPPSPSGLTCTPAIDNGMCVLTVTWTNEAAYAELRLSVNGVETPLAGNATSTMVVLTAGPMGTPLPTVCLDGTDANGTPFIQVCCAPFAMDCDMNGLPDVCQPFADCNMNGIADFCDIANGFADCNANGVPDVCEPDCNMNGIADECDITAGTSMDLDMNGIPDECLNEFIRGDVSMDGFVQLIDAIRLLEVLFIAGSPPATCDAALDFNDDDSIQILDAILLLQFLFGGGVPPMAPFPACGVDPTPSPPAALTCNVAGSGCP